MSPSHLNQNRLVYKSVLFIESRLCGQLNYYNYKETPFQVGITKSAMKPIQFCYLFNNYATHVDSYFRIFDNDKRTFYQRLVVADRGNRRE